MSPEPSPSHLLAAHLRQGRNRLEAHALLCAGWRPVAGPSAAFRVFRLPVSLPLQQADRSQLTTETWSLLHSIPTRTVIPTTPEVQEVPESQSYAQAILNNLNCQVRGHRNPFKVCSFIKKKKKAQPTFPSRCNELTFSLNGYWFPLPPTLLVLLSG